MQQYNYLMDTDFLTQLDAKRDRKVYAKITALTFQEEPIELIEGQVTQGSINIDGSSAIRRTCSLTLIAKELNINDYYWNIKTKFKLEVGLENSIDSRYPDIVWFPQGVFVITTFNTSQSVNSYTVSISGKDKMCFLNGDLGGNLPASIDFGVEEYYDKISQTTTYKPIPIKTIIREAVHTYAKEPYYNIIINDLDDAAVELLEYRGDTPLYLTRYDQWDQFDNATLDGSTEVRFADDESENPTYFAIEDLTKYGGYYDPRIQLAPEASIDPSRLVFKNDKLERVYTVAKIEYGQTAGYRKTDLTYAGDLISSIGEALTSILDKIVKMLGEYEYFYNLEGQFIFQKKRTYIQTSWNNLKKIEDEEYVESAAHSSAISYRFEDNNLITSFQNAPNLSNLKNDYSIWGQRESVSGAKIPIHYRYAIDEKPVYYKGYEDVELFSTQEELANKKEEERKKALESFKLKINSFTPQYTNSVDALGLTTATEIKDEAGNCVGWTPGWWDIRDWYAYHTLLNNETPDYSIKWYSQNSQNGYIQIRNLPGYKTHGLRNFTCWLISDNGDTTFEFHGTAWPAPNTYYTCTQYKSELINNQIVVSKVVPEVTDRFIDPFVSTPDSLTYLELIAKGKPTYIYNPKFADMATLTEEEMERFEAAWAEQVKNLKYACVDWREMIYQMALDYYKHHEEDEFLSTIAKNNPNHYPTGITGYEQYYLDLQGFWRQLYNPNPDPEYSEYSSKVEDDKFQALISEGSNENIELYIKGQYKEITDWSKIKESDVYALKRITYTHTYVDDDNITQSIEIDRYELVPWEDAIEIDYYSSFTITAGDDKQSNSYYISKGDGNYEGIYESVKNQIQKSEIFIYEDNKYIRLIKSEYAKNKSANNILGFYYFDDDEKEYGVFTDVILDKLYFNNGWYNKYLYVSRFDIEGKPITTALSVKYAIDYYGQYYDYDVNEDSDTLYWTLDLVNAPASLNFWFDFLDPSDSTDTNAQSLGQFSVKSVGDRTKVVNDTSVTAIYFREVPDVIFVKPEDYSGDTKGWTGYTTVYMQGTVESLFNISSQGKSAQDRLDELLYNHSYCIESVTIQSIPVYYLEPNTRIFVRDDQSKIHGEYIVSKMTIPLAYNGTMSITATKAPERIY